jgi:hypothetical protein
MTPAEFKRKWARYSGKETAAYQEHFNDLCALLGQPSPAAADPEARDDDCAKKLAKRTLTNLYNERPGWLANAHAKLDAAVAAAYNFPVDLTDEQILERLLALNQQRAADEEPATKKQLRVSRAKTDEEFV